MLVVAYENADNGFAVLSPRGELDASTVGRFRSAVARLAPRSNVIVDVSEVRFIDSAGLGALIGGIRRVRWEGGQIALACSRPNLVRLLREAGFNKVVPIAGSIDSAERLLPVASTSASSTPVTRSS